MLLLDATGTLVKKLTRIHDTSGNIFQFELVMNTLLHQLSVLQMLSEKHNANNVLYWLNEWERRGAPCPKEIIMYNSAAFKSAAVRSFGRSTDLNDYMEKCFLYLTGETIKLPPCYIRLDVAHFINAARKWKLWSDEHRLRDLYIRCLGLLIKATSLEMFREIFIYVVTLALSPNEIECAHLPEHESSSVTPAVKICQWLEDTDTEIQDRVIRN